MNHHHQTLTNRQVPLPCHQENMGPRPQAKKYKAETFMPEEGFEPEIHQSERVEVEDIFTTCAIGGKNISKCYFYLHKLEL